LPRLDRLPLALIVLDGWGFRAESRANAIRSASPQNMDELGARFPSLLLEAAGAAVGLPPGYIGNSEVGHLCLGAGRTVRQPLGLIFEAIASGEFFRNPSLVAAFRAAAAGGGAMHALGLVSDGGVHSHLDHAAALARMAREQGCDRLFFHAFMDGRDTPPQSGVHHLERLGLALQREGVGRVASVTGRYFAMDRDQRWDRTAKAYAALVRGEGRRAPSPAAAVREAYARGETDEFIEPTVIVEGDAPIATLSEGDAAIFFNFRPDRARQLTRALTAPSFGEFERPDRPALAAFVCFTRYEEASTLPIAFAKQQPVDVLGEVLAAHAIPQTRCAETEKYAHVTYFFNGVREQAFPGEDRILVPSPRVATYDLAPEMSAREVTASAIAALAADPARVLVVNLANADMVGHTGRFEETVRACKVVDECVGRLVGDILARGGGVIVTADHGNAELMVDPETGAPHTAHTMNPVPAILCGAPFRGRPLAPGGLLADVAPTLLDVLEIPPPKEMDGRTLLRD
jgi:2,3-bisphosphoglycerate-independent phosphoglycerate mutase